jgi:sn-glycerol 3-phosphate transport system substrate-binding protein
MTGALSAICPVFAAGAIGVVFPVLAVTEIQWWHAMTGALYDGLSGIAQKFNESQADYKVVPVFKGSYPETMAAAIAAYRGSHAPDILASG